MLYDRFEAQDWDSTRALLSNNPLAHQDPDEALDLFENFLFRIDIDSKTALEETIKMNDIVQLFLRNKCLYHRITNDMSCTLVHNLCMENKHEALAMLLRNMNPLDAKKGVQRVSSMSFDVTDEGEGEGSGDHSIYHDVNVWHTPMQTAWSGKLMDKQGLEELQMIHDFNDLTRELEDLWMTTVILLLAFDCKPIYYNYAISGTRNKEWNVLHVLSNYGPRSYDATMMLALKLHPQLAEQISCDGCLPIHEACKNQISYGMRQRPKNGKMDAPSKANHCQLPENSFGSPALMLLNANKSAAFSRDPNGRLPLHLTILHHRENEETYKTIQFQERECECECEEWESQSTSKADYELDIIPVIEGMIAANPSALECPEPSTGLSPVLFAASGNVSGLDTIFTLLSHNPTAVINKFLRERTSPKPSPISTSRQQMSMPMPCNPKPACPCPCPSRNGTTAITTKGKHMKTNKRVVSPVMWASSPSPSPSRKIQRTISYNRRD